MQKICNEHIRFVHWSIKLLLGGIIFVLTCCMQKCFFFSWWVHFLQDFCVQLISNLQKSRMPSRPLKLLALLHGSDSSIPLYMWCFVYISSLGFPSYLWLWKTRESVYVVWQNSVRVPRTRVRTQIFSACLFGSILQFFHI